MLSAGLTALLSPVGLVVAAIVALGAAFAYARIEKQKMIDEMAESDSLEELERKLRDNLARQKAVIDETTRTRLVPNFGGLVAGFTIQKVPDESQLAPLRREYELLTAAIEKKREAEKKAADAQAEMDRITEQARQQIEELMASMNAGVNSCPNRRSRILPRQMPRLPVCAKSCSGSKTLYPGSWPDRPSGCCSPKVWNSNCPHQS